MFKNSFKTAVRILFKNKAFSLINILGLTVGMAAAILILLWVRFELSYDRFNINISSLYRAVILDKSTDNPTHIAVTPAPLADVLKSNYPEIVRASRFSNFGESLLNYDGKKFIENNVAFADPDFLDMFTLSFIEGDPNTALSAPFSIILTEDAAMKILGETDVRGKVIQYSDEHDLTVTGIIENIPENSSIKFDYIIPFDFLKNTYELDYWEAYIFYTLVQLDKHADLTGVNQKIETVLNGKVSDDNDLVYLQPFQDIHLHSGVNYDFIGRGDINNVWIFSSLAFFVLAIACINFVNFTTGLAGIRAKEIGIRKTIGAGRSNLIMQLLIETVIIISIAFIAAIMLTELFLPLFNHIAGRNLSLNFFGDVKFLFGLAGIAALSILSCGIYPAIMLSAFKPVNIMKGFFGGSVKGSNIRKGLIVCQFTFTIILITGTLIVSGQLEYMQNKDMGFDEEHVLYMPMRDSLKDNFTAFRNELLSNPAVHNVTASFQLPNNIGSSPGEMEWEGKQPGQNVRINAGLVDYDYFETFDMQIIEGRAFSREFPSDDSAAYIVNETAVKAMGMENPIGKRFAFWDIEGKIIGVVKDFHAQPLRKEINPIVLKIDHYWLNHVYVKISSENIHAIVAGVEQVWNKFETKYPFDYHFLDEALDRQFRQEKNIRAITRYFTGTAVILSCLGLLGLAAFTIERRAKELGIRKVLGASFANIIGMVSGEFLILIVLSNVIAVPFAWYLAEKWLDNFAFRIDLNIGLFLMAGSLALIVALLTISFQVLRAALADPVKSIRYE